MKRLFKKAAAGLLATTMVLSMGLTALAHTEMENMVFAGYDLTDPANPNRIYNEVIDGMYTNKQVLVPVTPEWKIEGYESVYPYAGYSRMYLDGKAQNVTCYNNLTPQWETRRQDYMWEIAGDHIIWERQQTKIDNKTWAWDFGNEYFNIPDSALLTRTVRKAEVLELKWTEYGFGKYDLEGNILNGKKSTDEQEEVVEMYEYFGMDVKAIDEWERVVSEELTVDKLSERNAYNLYEVTDAEIAAMIPVVYNKNITAKFDKKGNEGLATKNVAEEYLEHADDNWAWDADSLIVKNDAKISWTAPAYEMAEPYKQYQFLVVNGVVFDGSEDENGNVKERIVRYTGGCANPEIRWAFWGYELAKDENGDFFENVYEVVEFKIVDGVVARDENGNLILRKPTGEYGKTYFKVVGDDVEYWVVDKAGNACLLEVYKNYAGNILNPAKPDSYTSVSYNYAG